MSCIPEIKCTSSKIIVAVPSNYYVYTCTYPSFCDLGTSSELVYILRIAGADSVRVRSITTVEFDRRARFICQQGTNSKHLYVCTYI